MSDILDDDGQPPKAYYEQRRSERLVSELLGLCKGMICDGVVSDAEAISLTRWLVGHPDAVVGYPGKVVSERLVRVFADGRIDEEERSDLQQLLADLTGEDESHVEPMNLSARLPLDDPAPTIFFNEVEHVFTGRMLYGTRKECEQAAVDRGARVGATVTRRTNFLVVGPIASRAWLESTHGRKILRAIELRQAGSQIAIVAEEPWILSLDRGTEAAAS